MTDIHYVTVDQESGEIGICSLPPDDDETYYEVPAGTEPDSIYIKDGGILYYPPKPANSYVVFDYDSGSWVDPRTGQDWMNELNATRAESSMSRIDFVLKCHQFGIVTEEEAELAIDGGFPPAFQAIIETMPIEQRFEARVRWKGATVVDRSMSLVQDMGAAINIDQWTLDKVFNVPWPDPIADLTDWVYDAEREQWHP